MRRVMAEFDLCAERGQAPGGRTLTLITSAYRETELQAQFRNATHPRAADADEMEAALASEQTRCACLNHFR